VTGIVADAGWREYIGKSFQLVRELCPGFPNVAILMLQSYWAGSGGPDYRQGAEEAGVRLTCLCLASPVQEAAYRQVFADLKPDRPAVIFVANGPENFTFRELIVGLANEARIPAFYQTRTFVEAGGLISYGNNPPGSSNRLDLTWATGVRGALVSSDYLGAFHQSPHSQNAGVGHAAVDPRSRRHGDRMTRC
jgi:hypothetical protein